MSDRQALIDAALQQIEKNFGPGSAMRLGDHPREVAGVIPTGSIALDKAIGIGGYPRGRIVEIFGAESAGKSTLALHAVANAQKGGSAAYIDAEHSLDPSYGEALGVDVDSLVVSQPDTGEQALEICELLIKSGGIDLVVVDSVAALVPRAELEGDFGNANVGLQARLMSQAMRKLLGVIYSTNTCAIFINQLRSTIQPFGASETTPGGRAIRFYASVRLDVRRIETEKTGTEATGNKTRVRAVKNKVAPPHREAIFTIQYGQGISKEAELVDLGIQTGLVEKSGAWLTYAGERWHGKAKAVEWLQGRLGTAGLLEEQIRERL